MKRKTLIFFLLTTLLLTSATAMAGNNTGPINWMKYPDGIAKAKAEGKKIYINFHADWCYYCKVMEKTTFKDKKVADYLNDNFITIRVDTEKEKKLAREYRIQGLPSNWFLEPDGKRISMRPGYLNPNQLLDNLRFIYEEKYKANK